MNRNILRRSLQLRMIACSLAVALILTVLVSASVSAHPGHEHADDSPASWTERIDEVAAGGAVVLVVGGVFWLTNRRSGESEAGEQLNTAPDTSDLHDTGD